MNQVAARWVMATVDKLNRPRPSAPAVRKGPVVIQGEAGLDSLIGRDASHRYRFGLCHASSL